MESATQTPLRTGTGGGALDGRPLRPPGRGGVAPSIGVAIGLAWVAALVVADLIVGPDTVMVGPLAAAPLFTAVLAGPWATGAVAVVATGAAVASGTWNTGGFDDPYWARLALTGFGSALAVAVSLYRRRAAARTDRLRILEALSEIADGSLPLAETLRRVTEVLVPAVADLCMLDSVHERRVTRIAVRAAGRDDAELIERRVTGRPHSLPKWMVTAERRWRRLPRWRARVREEELRRMAASPEDLEFLRSLRIRSTINAPITARDRNLGALTLITAWSRRRYTADDVRFAQILASRIGLALDNAGLFSDLESFERRMDTVMAAIDEAVLIRGPEGRLIFANPAAARMLGLESAEEVIAAPLERLGERLVVRDEDGAAVAVEALLGAGGAAGDRPRQATLRVMRRGTGTERWLRTNSRPIAGPDGAPLYSVTVIEDVTDVKRGEFAERLLARTGELVSHSTDYARTLEQVARLLVPAFADWCSVRVPRPDGSVEQVAVAHRDAERARAAAELGGRFPLRLDHGGPLAEALRSGAPQLVETIAGGGDGAGSAIAAPMTAGGRVVGALLFGNERGSRTFDRGDLELAGEAARRAGLALENARLAAELAEVAAALQRELLPRTVPELPGWEVRTLYEPAGEVNEVGGDFYEVFRVPDGWAVVLGDVSGRGAAAASLTGEARHTIRTAGQLGADPCAGLRLLDENFRRRPGAPLCSVAMLILPESADGACEARCYLAGHPHPLLLREGEVIELGEPGPALGVVDDPAWEPATVVVEPGDQLVLYTDGVIEARRRDGPRFGARRLRERIAGAGDPDAVIERVQTALADHLSPETEDDAALIAIRRLGRAAPAPGGPSRRRRRAG